MVEIENYGYNPSENIVANAVKTVVPTGDYKYLSLDDIYDRYQTISMLTSYDIVYGVYLTKDEVSRILLRLKISYYCNHTVLNRTQKIFF